MVSTQAYPGRLALGAQAVIHLRVDHDQIPSLDGLLLAIQTDQGLATLAGTLDRLATAAARRVEEEGRELHRLHKLAWACAEVRLKRRQRTIAMRRRAAQWGRGGVVAGRRDRDWMMRRSRRWADRR